MADSRFGKRCTRDWRKDVCASADPDQEPDRTVTETAGQKAFILGLGAQKCGTGWLYHYLSGLSGVDFGFAKEYQTFYPRSPTVQFRQQMRALGTLLISSISGNADAAEARKARFFISKRPYYDYFADLLEQPRTVATGDITPAYSGLRAPVLDEIRGNFARRGITVHPVFLMRDPVDRCWSAVRMARRAFARERREGKTASSRLMAMSEEEHLLELHHSAGFVMRTRYDRTVAEIEKVFDADAIIYAFFEQLFTEETVRRICDRLGLNYKPPDFGRTVRMSERCEEVSDSAKAQIARFYQPVYAFAAERYGEDLIGRIWPSYRYIA